MKKQITVYDMLVLCGEELVNINYNGFTVLQCKPANDLCDLLGILNDGLLESLVYKITDNAGVLGIYSTTPLKEKIKDYE